MTSSLKMAAEMETNGTYDADFDAEFQARNLTPFQQLQRLEAQRNAKVVSPHHPKSKTNNERKSTNSATQRNIRTRPAQRRTDDQRARGHRSLPSRRGAKRNTPSRRVIKRDIKPHRVTNKGISARRQTSCSKSTDNAKDDEKVCYCLYEVCS